MKGSELAALILARVAEHGDLQVCVLQTETGYYLQVDSFDVETEGPGMEFSVIWVKGVEDAHYTQREGPEHKFFEVL